MRTNWTGEEKDVKGGPITEAMRADLLEDTSGFAERGLDEDPPSEELIAEIKAADIHGLRALANSCWGYGDGELGDYLVVLIASVEGDSVEPPQKRW